MMISTSRIEELVSNLLKEEGWSDLHLHEGKPPMMRGRDMDVGAVSDWLMTEMDFRALFEKDAPDWMSALEKKPDGYDFAIAIDGVRFRVNAFRFSGRKLGAVLRRVNSRIPAPQDIGIGETMLSLMDKDAGGLILVTGATGSGKSTTMAAMTQHVNERRTCHILTLEDPVEYVYPQGVALVTQREIGEGKDAVSFAGALKAALREDPDIIIVGELRDSETARIALEASQTGHLVISTMHTKSAASTVDRLLNMFDSSYQSIARAILADSLLGIISQIIVPKKGGGRIAAREILLNTSGVAAAIRDGKPHQIPNLIREGRELGMALMNEVLADFVKKDLVEEAVAMGYAYDVAELQRLISSPAPGRSGVGLGSGKSVSSWM